MWQIFRFTDSFSLSTEVPILFSLSGLVSFVSSLPLLSFFLAAFSCLCVVSHLTDLLLTLFSTHIFLLTCTVAFCYSIWTSFLFKNRGNSFVSVQNSEDHELLFQSSLPATLKLPDVSCMITQNRKRWWENKLWRMREAGAQEKRLPSSSARTGMTYLCVTERTKTGQISRELLGFLCLFFHPAMHKALLEAASLWCFLAFWRCKRNSLSSEFHSSCNRRAFWSQVFPLVLKSLSSLPHCALSWCAWSLWHPRGKKCILER